MAATNRAAKITKLVTTLKKQYKPAAPPKDAPLLETLLLGCLLENSPLAEAQQTFEKLQADYFDWNEVRVSTKIELAEVCRALNDPAEAAARLRGTLQSAFEAFYAFDLESMKKQNLGQSIKQLEKLEGITPFVVAFAVQNALGGHAIPVNSGLLTALVTLEVITPAEAAIGTVPGLERAVPKNKGPEVGSLMHQLGVEVGKNPYGQTARKRLLAIDPKCKDRLPKRPPAPEPEPKPKPKKAAPKPPAEKPAAEKPAAKAPAKKALAAPPKKAAAPKAAASKPAAPKKKVVKKAAKKKAAPPKKAAAKKKPTKKPAPVKKVKKAAKKAAAKKKTGPAKRKPR